MSNIDYSFYDADAIEVLLRDPKFMELHGLIDQLTIFSLSVPKDELNDWAKSFTNTVVKFVNEHMFPVFTLEEVCQEVSHVIAPVIGWLALDVNANSLSANERFDSVNFLLYRVKLASDKIRENNPGQLFA